MSDDAGSAGECLFCGIVAGTVPSVTVLQEEAVVAFMDIDPGADGHLLVVPRRHSADLLSIPVEDLVATTLAAQRIAGGVRTAFGAEGVNLLNCSGTVAWQTVFHFHLHVIPRYADRNRDRMELPFEPGHPADHEGLARRARVLAAVL